MDLNHYSLGSFESCKVGCSATHPQSLHQCFHFLSKSAGFYSVYCTTLKKAHTGVTVHLLLTYAVVLKVVFHLQTY